MGKMKRLSNDQLKKIVGGVILPPLSDCSVQCANGEWKSRDCGINSTCSVSGTKIACNSESEGTEMCPPKKP